MKRSLYFSLALGFLLALAACGGSSSPSNVIHVTLTDFQFSPNTFTVPAGAQISFTAVNSGAVEHSFVIMKLGVQVKDHFTDADMQNAYWKQLAIEPGQTITDTFTAPGEAGTYQIVCAEPGHFEAGMVAKLIVVK
ncbi:MAG TPA: plastocyanin/azurin family copper-binding protein [Anaerolineales bacterium]|nr:plastocyanin/azurin family copper-binding protein [Anaerolineales bacterium]